MTFVKEKSETIVEGVGVLKKAMIADYGDWADKRSEIALKIRSDSLGTPFR